MDQDSKIRQIIKNFESMIQHEMADIQLQIKIINANQSGHFTLNKILVKNAKQYIYLDKINIKTWIELKQKYENKLSELNQNKILTN